MHSEDSKGLLVIKIDRSKILENCKLPETHSHETKTRPSERIKESL